MDVQASLLIAQHVSAIVACEEAQYIMSRALQCKYLAFMGSGRCGCGWLRGRHLFGDSSSPLWDGGWQQVLDETEFSQLGP